MRKTCLALLLLLCPAALAAQVERTDTVRIAAGPDLSLLTIVHLPQGPGPHPVVLVRNPYRTRGGPMGWLAERMVPHGYAVVEQDVRGTGGSGGSFVPFAFDVADGTITLDWLTAQRGRARSHSGGSPTSAGRRTPWLRRSTPPSPPWWSAPPGRTWAPSWHPAVPST
jgi:hypothetical protein